MTTPDDHKPLASTPEPRAADPSVSHTESRSRIGVQKTYKLYIKGAFPRTESGRTFKIHRPNGDLLANMCRASRKDFREAVLAARGAFGGWSGRSAFNRGQILYRIAEMIESRRAQFIEELVLMGSSPGEAEQEVTLATDRTLYYAGWSDKFQQIFSSVNPVNSSHFNFSMLEPTGVVGIIASEKPSLTGLISVLAPAIVGGNTVVALASSSLPLPAITLAEVLNSSDVPGGVVNILTGYPDELSEHFASHMDVNALVYCGGDAETLKAIQIAATENVKRVIHHTTDWQNPEAQNPYLILDTQETKTTWHPIGQ